MDKLNAIIISQPSWVFEIINPKNIYKTKREMMSLAIRISKLNVINRTGGPFGAAIYEKQSGKLISIGVNRVVPEHCSVAHAEIMAIMKAQISLQKYRLDLAQEKDYVLASSSQPCSMCFSAIISSGLKYLIFGASRKDVENKIGFNEGPLQRNWLQILNSYGIMVKKNILRKEACEVLKLYKNNDGIIY